MPKISIVIPVYKTEPYIQQCVESVLSQTFEAFELILVDDGSPDNSGAICDEYAQTDHRIKVIHQENQGQATARNKALDWIFSYSDSEYITFVDSDDWVHPRYLELLYSALLKCKTNISQCRYKVVNSWIEPENVYDARIINVTPGEQYSDWYSAFFWGKLFHKNCFLNVRFPEGKIFEDVLIWYKMLFRFGEVAIVDAELYYYFQRSDGTTNRTWTSDKLAQIEAWEDQLTFAQKYGDKSVLQMVLRRLCWVYKHQCEEITTSNLISEKERKQYRSRLLKRMRFILLKYRKELKGIDIYKEYTAWAYNKLYRLYKTIKQIVQKTKKQL